MASDLKKTKTYSPGQVVVVVGLLTIDTFDEVNVSKAEDTFSHSSSATGHITRVENMNNIGTIEIVLPQATTQNKDLVDMYASVLSNLSTSSGFVSVSVQDTLGETRHVITEGSFKKVPDSKYGKDVNNRTWVCEGRLTDNYPAGNDYISAGV